MILIFLRALLCKVRVFSLVLVFIGKLATTMAVFVTFDLVVLYDELKKTL